MAQGMPQASPSASSEAGESSDAPPAAVQISVLLKEGKVLFALARRDFVDLLTRVLQQPLGAVVGCVGEGGDRRALSHLQDSVMSLHDPFFSDGRQHEAAEIPGPMDVSGLLARSTPRSAPANVPIKVRGVPHISWRRGVPHISWRADGSGGFHVRSTCPMQMIAFTPSEECGAFLATWRHTQSAPYFVGIVPANDGQLQAMLKQPNGVFNRNWGIHVYIFRDAMSQVYYNGTSVPCDCLTGGSPLPRLVVGEMYSMRLQVSGGGQPAMQFCDAASEQWRSVQIPNWPIPARRYGYIPFLHLYVKQDLHVTEMKFGDALPDAADQRPGLNRAAQFLITNKLEIFGSGSLRAGQVMQEYGDTLQEQTRNFGTPELNRLIERALCGGTDVLDYALSGNDGGLSGPASPESSLGSPSTMMSAEFVRVDDPRLGRQEDGTIE